jgi:arylsulfatase A-like enzyme
MRRTNLTNLVTIIILAITGTVQSAVKEDYKQPNIIFVFVDDMGFGDLACYGNKVIKTPNLDKMASEGILFTNFTVSSPVCSPSRVAVMTGLYPARTRFHGHLASIESNRQRSMPNYLDASIPTLTRLLNSEGYVTAHFGKWHMGGPQDKNAPAPESYGIDVSATVLSNGAGYNKKGDTRANSSFRIMQHTLDFIESNSDKLFFVNCWLLDPHSILAPNQEQLAHYPELESMAKGFTSATQVYSAVITDIDNQMKRLFDKLDELGISENTLVVFSSDNGPAPIWGIDTAHSGTGSVGPFRGCKASLYEGGIRVPFIVRWPGNVPEGKVDDETIISGIDLLPTFCSFAGVQFQEKLTFDGQDMSPALLGTPTPRKHPLMWEYRYSPWGRHIQKSPALAIRDGDWKLMINPDGSRTELYNLKKNPCEVDNLASEFPEIVMNMSNKLLEWHKSLPDVESMPEKAGSFEYPWTTFENSQE